MLIITILYAVIFYQIIRGFWEQDGIWYKDPKFWLHMLSIGIIAAITTLN